MTSKSKHKSSAAGKGQNGSSLITSEKLQSMYAAMLRCRMVEQRAKAQWRSGARKGISMGREAAAAGVLADIKRDDALVIGPGDVAAAYVKGVPLRGLGGMDDAGWRGHAARHVLPACAETSTRLALAVGCAAAARQKKDGLLAAVFYDAATPAPAAWLQTMRYAARHALPVLFICWNTRPTRDLYRDAERCGFPGIAVEGHDAVAVYRVASESIAHARRGNGPTLIECKAGFRAGYGGGLFDGANDALGNMEAYLRSKGLYDLETRRKVIADYKGEMAALEKRKRAQVAARRLLLHR